MENNRKHVDKLITSVPGEWKFDEQVSKHFDEHVQKSVPLYLDVQKLVTEISEWFISDNSIIYDIGCSTGKTLAMLQEKHINKKNIRYIGIEESRPMIDIAREKNKEQGIQFIHLNVCELNEFSNGNFITSLYTLQFLKIHQRRSVLQKIYNGLVEGGAFILVEKIRAEASLFENIWTDIYFDFKEEQGFNSEQIIAKNKSLRGVLIPLTLSQNIEMLQSVGFNTIDVFMKWNNFVGIIAVKISSFNNHKNNQERNTL